jgi:hypothetical protein
MNNIANQPETFSTEQVLAALRETPTSASKVTKRLRKCEKLGCICVSKEIFVAALQTNAAHNNCAPMELLVMLENYSHAFIWGGCYWIGQSYLLSPNE